MRNTISITSFQIEGLFLILLLLLTTHLKAQETLIKGKVFAESYEMPLEGASVLLKGSQRGTITNAQGEFQLRVPASARFLLVSFIGYQELEVAIGGRNTMNIILTESNLNLEEVVVIGYGTQFKKTITGNVSSIKADQLKDIPAQSFDQLIQGKAAGVSVNMPNGVLNNPPVFRIRGINSITLSSYPLIVIDGIPTFTGDLASPYFHSVSHNALSGIDPADIERIEILKDASAAAIYGSRASAGVVLVTTKQGTKGKPRISWDSWLGWTQTARFPDLLNAQEFVEVKNEAANNAGLRDQFFLDSMGGNLIDTRWFDHAYQTGTSQNHHLGISGGSEETSYYLSLGYSNQEGMIRFNTFNRLNGRFNLTHQVNKKVKLGSNIGYSETFSQAPNTGSLNGQSFWFVGLARLVLLSPPNVSALTEDGSYNISNGGGFGPNKNLQPLGFGYGNLLPVLEEDKYTNKSRQLQATAFIEVNLFEGLKLKTQFGKVNISNKDYFYSSPEYSFGFFSNGYVGNQSLEWDRWNWQNTITYEKEIQNEHLFTFLAGFEEQYSSFELFGADLFNTSDPFFTTFNNSFQRAFHFGESQENYLRSWLGRLTYTHDKYLFQANFRQDAYSAFASGNKRGSFWGVSAGWNISNEKFWQKGPIDWINYLKIRGSYGEVGNTNVGDYASLGLYFPGFYANDPALSFGQAGNPELAWESSRKTDFGFQFGLFDDLVQGEYSWFNTYTRGLLLETPQPSSMGIPNNQIVANVGEMQNMGHEFALTAFIMQNENFSWQSSFNLSLLRNEVLKLSDGNADIIGFTSNFEPTNMTRVGESIGSIYAIHTPGINFENGRRIFEKADGTLIQYQHLVQSGESRWTLLSDGSPTSAPNIIDDGRVYGPSIPKWFGGWDHRFYFDRFDLNVQFNYAGGFYVYNGTKAGLRDQRSWNNHTDVLDRWTESNMEGSIPRLVYGDNVSNGSAIPISENVEKGDFLRLRTITLGYSFPESWIRKAGIQQLRLYSSVFNALLFTNYSGTDPEVSTNGNSNLTPGVDRNSVPMPRTYTLGLNFSF